MRPKYGNYINVTVLSVVQI